MCTELGAPLTVRDDWKIEEPGPGEVLVQKRCKVEPGDTPESLKARVQPLEGPAYITAINRLVAEIRNLMALEGISSKAGFMAREKLVWLLRNKPESLEELARMIDALQADGDVACVLLAAVGAAQTPAAQGLLVDFLGNRNLPESLRASAAFALSQVAEPIPGAVDLAVKLSAEGSKSLRSVSMMLLGSLADNYGNATVPEPTMMAGSPERPPASTPGVGAGGDLPSPTRILTTSPILSEKRGGA